MTGLAAAVAARAEVSNVVNATAFSEWAEAFFRGEQLPTTSNLDSIVKFFQGMEAQSSQLQEDRHLLAQSEEAKAPWGLAGFSLALSTAISIILA